MATIEERVENLEKVLAEERASTETMSGDLQKLTQAVARLKESIDVANKLAEKAPPAAAPQKENVDYKKGDRVHSGWLDKKGATRKHWLRRWCVLEAKKAIIYFANKEDTEPRGVIPLANAQVFPHVEKKGKVKPLFFNLRVEHRDFIFRAESKEDKDAWVRAIKENVYKGSSSDGKKSSEPKPEEGKAEETNRV